MKIAFVLRIFPAISESFILSQITALIEAGHEVEIFAEADPREPMLHDDIARYNLLSKTTYIDHIPSNKTSRRLKTCWLLLKNLFSHPCLVTRGLFENIRSTNGFDYVNLYFLFKFLGKRFDILQCHFGWSGNVGAFLKRAGFKTKVVTAFHGCDITAYVRRHGRNVYKDLFKTGDIFTYNSRATQNILLELGCPPAMMIKLPMAIDVRKIPFIERKLLPSEKINILSVGRLVEMKGREYAIRAVASIAPEFPNIVYNIVGDGPLRQPLQDMIERLGASEYIRLLGWVDDKTLDRLYRSSHIFLHPSVTASDGNMEGQGVVLLEAQTYGMPVVATKHNAFVETVLDGQSGILVEQRDIPATAAAIEHLLNQPHLWPQMGRIGRQFVENHYDRTVLNNQLLDIYNQLQTNIPPA